VLAEWAFEEVKRWDMPTAHELLEQLALFGRHL
jgi:hypothetical protein